MSEAGKRDIEEDIFQMMQACGANSRRELCTKLGVSKNMIRKWELQGEIPKQFLLRTGRPVRFIVALAVLRDPQLTDAEARSAARTVLEHLEAVHD